jgi:lupus La protein
MQEEMRSKNICAQMEFYFGDSNLRYDKFLRDLISKDPAGFVELAVLSKFRKLQKLASGDVSIISEACKSSDLLQLSEDEAKIKRRFPVPLVEDSEGGA